MGNIHHITFATGKSRATGLPYSDTQKMLVDSIQSQTNRQVIHYTYGMEELKTQNWWDKVKEYPTKYPDPWGREGLYCAYKVFPALELVEKIPDGDFIYYTDSSAYFREPFQQNIDRLFDYVEYNGHACGSAGNDFKHNSFGCCDNPNVWNAIWPEVMPNFGWMLGRPHILASWYCFQKNPLTTQFIKEWAHYFTYELNGKPLCTYHHTVDQSIFNILVYKYGMKVFFNNTHHDHNKNHNNVHRQLNAETDGSIENLKKWFHNPNNL
jgi:hypothetical protein